MEMKSESTVLKIEKKHVNRRYREENSTKCRQKRPTTKMDLFRRLKGPMKETSVKRRTVYHNGWKQRGKKHFSGYFRHNDWCENNKKQYLFVEKYFMAAIFE